MGQSNSGNYNYIGSGTPDYYGSFSTKLKKGAESVYGWTDAIEEGLIGATALMPWLAPVTVPLGIVVGGVSIGAHVAEGLMIGTDKIVDWLDLKSSINGTIERDKYPERYQYGNTATLLTLGNTIEKASTRVGGVNFNNNTFKDQLSETEKFGVSSTDRFGNTINSAFSQYAVNRGLTTR